MKNVWFTVGSKLKNGAKIRAVRNEPDKVIVCADWGDQHVTWRVDDQGGTFLGHYFANTDDGLRAAMIDFRTR